MTEGILLIDKAAGCTSHDVVGQVRRALGTRTVGHAGTLDPFATGLLVVLVGRYTRASNYLVLDDKRYIADVCFGTSTDTDDIEGRVIKTGDASLLTEQRVRDVLAQFTGEIEQVPPQYSAISVGGVRAYKAARAGESVELAPRTVTIHQIKLLKMDSGSVAGVTNPVVAQIEVHCSKGTYIRALARDIGEALGVPAHLSALRRTQSGGYYIADALPQAQLKSNVDAVPSHLRTGANAVLGIDKIEITPEQAQALKNGQRPITTHVPHDAALLAHIANDPIAFAKIDNGLLVSLRGF